MDKGSRLQGTLQIQTNSTATTLMTSNCAPGANTAWTRRRTAAQQYRPKRIRLLLVAESPPERLQPYVAPFMVNLDTLAPERIILVKVDVYDVLRPAMKQAGSPVVEVRIPFPSSGQQVEFRQKFRQALVRAGLEKLIRPLPASKSEVDD